MEALSRNLRRLLAELGDLEHVEVLLLLARTPQRHWSAAQVGGELGLSHAPSNALERLAHLNLVDVRLAQDVLYRYAPTRADLASNVEDLARAYGERRLAVFEALQSNAAIAFADAFRVRGKRDA